LSRELKLGFHRREAACGRERVDRVGVDPYSLPQSSAERFPPTRRNEDDATLR
jgi:hypothetical protein